MTDYIDKLLADYEQQRGTETKADDPSTVSLHSLIDELDGYMSLLQEPLPESEWSYLQEGECEQAIAAASHLLEQSVEETGYVSRDDQNRVGSMIGNYRLIAHLGSGGMGAVYRAINVSLDKEVALKTLPAHRMKNPKAISRFQREMRAIGKLDHPHIVRALDAGEADGQPYLVMEAVEGVNLSSLIRQSGTLSIADASEVIRQAALGLQYIHKQGLIHRDIKPSNIMLTREGEIKIMDLGLAQIGGLLEEDELTKTGQVMGTLDYMAPEQALDSGKVDYRADIYSLGVTFYKLLTGVTPFDQAKFLNPLQKTRAMLAESTPSIRQHCPGLPDRLIEIVDRSLARTPDDRFQSSEAMLTPLRPFCSSSNLVELSRVALYGTTSEFSSSVQNSEVLSRFSRWQILLKAVLLAACLLGVMFLSRDAFRVENEADNQSLSVSSVAPSSENLTSIVESPEGFWDIPSLNGMSRIYLQGICGQGPVLVGYAEEPSPTVYKACYWTPDSRTQELEVRSTFPITDCLGISLGGEKVICRGDFAAGVWDRQNNQLRQIPLDEFRADYYCQASHVLVGIQRVSGGKKRLVRLDLSAGFEDPEFEMVTMSATLPVENRMQIVACDNRAQTIIFASHGSNEAAGVEYWVWTEEAGFQKAPQQFQGGLIEFVSAQGRFLAGATKDKYALVYDRQEARQHSLSQIKHTVCNWISPDGEVFLGQGKGYQGWIVAPEYPEGPILRKTMQPGIDHEQSDVLTRPIGVSADGKYLFGSNMSQLDRVTGWVIETERLGVDFQAHLGEGKKTAQLSGIYEIDSLSGHDSIEAWDFAESSEGPCVVGRSRSAVFGRDVGFVWTPQDGVQRLDEGHDILVSNCISVSRDLDSIVCKWDSASTRGENYAVWRRATNQFYPILTQQFRPNRIAKQTGQLLGTFQKKQGTQLLVSVDIDVDKEHPRHALPVENAEFPETGFLQIVVMDVRGEVIVLQADRGSSVPDASSYWIWTPQVGYQKAPECFLGQASLNHVSENGRFLAGKSAEQKPIVYDRSTDELTQLTDYPVGTCNWVSSDGRLAFGHLPDGQGWMVNSDYPNGVHLESLVNLAGLVQTSVRLSMPVRVSQYGNYLLGITRRDGNDQSCWVVNLAHLNTDIKSSFPEEPWEKQEKSPEGNRELLEGKGKQ